MLFAGSDQLIAGNILKNGTILTWGFTTEGVLPSAPGQLTAAVAGRAVILNWTAPVKMGSGQFLGYRVHRAVVAGGVAGEPVLLASTNSTTFLDASVAWNVTYRYSVTAASAYGEGPASIGASVTVVQEARSPEPIVKVDHPIAGPSVAWAAVAIAIAAVVAAAEAARSRRRGDDRS